jgi:hypothetical protein
MGQIYLFFVNGGRESLTFIFVLECAGMCVSRGWVSGQNTRQETSVIWKGG